jgi:protein TonB
LASTPPRRWLVAGFSALILHLAALAAFLVVPRYTLKDDEAPQAMVVTLVTEPPAAANPSDTTAPDAAQPAEAPAVEAQPGSAQPPLAVPTSEPPADAPPPAAPVVPIPDVPPPAEPAVPVPDVPPPAEPAVPVPNVPPPPEQAVPVPEIRPPPQAAAPARAPIPNKASAARPRPRAPPSSVPPSSAPPSSAPPSSTNLAAPRSPETTTPSENVIGPYRNSLAAHVQVYERYPALARARRAEGIVVLHVTIQRDGQIAAMSIEHGSGWEPLDREALATLKRADPLPPVPASVPGATIDLVFPLSFRLE